MAKEDNGASAEADRATAAEPVVSALRDGIPSAKNYANGDHPRERVDREFRFMQLQLVSLLRSDWTWQDRCHIADALSANELAYKNMRSEIDAEERSAEQAARTGGD